MFERYIGIDISKAWMDVDLGDRVHRVRQEAFEAFLDHYGDVLKPSLCVMESTGGYEYRAARALTERGIAVHLAHPNKVVAFMRARGRLAKTDALDARLLSDYGAFVKPHEIRPCVEEEQYYLHTLGSRLSQLKAMLHQERCRLSHPTMQEDVLQASLQATIALLTQQIQALEAEILRKVRTTP